MKVCRKVVAVCCSSCCRACKAAAQHPDDEYYPYAEREELRETLATDSAIFYRAVQGVSDLYGDHTDFNLPQVARKRRGLDHRAVRTSLSGMDLSYRYLPLLRLLGPKRSAARACGGVRGVGLLPAA